MYRYLFLSVCLGVFPLHMSCQSLLEDTLQVRTKLELAEAIQYEAPDSALWLLEQVKNASHSLNYLYGLKEYYRIRVFLEGTILGDGERGLEQANEYLDFLQEFWPEQISSALLSKAIFLQTSGRPDSAIAYYERALPHLKTPQQKKNYPVVLGNLAIIYDELKLTQEAGDYARRAFDLYKIHKDTIGMVGVLNTWANVKLLEDNTEENHSLLKKAYRLALLQGHPENLMTSTFNLGYSFIRQDSIEQGIYLLNEALSMTQKLRNLADQIHAKIGLANNLLSIGRYKEAEGYRRAAVADTVHLTPTPALRRMIFQMEMDFLSYEKSYKQALDLLPSYLHHRDEDFSEKNAALALRLNKKIEDYEDEQVRLNQVLLIQRQQIKINLLIYGLIILALVGLLSYAYWRRKQDNLKHELAETALTQKFLEQESLMKGRMQERDRISKELHDEIGASVTTIALQSQLLSRKLPAGKYPEIERIRQYTRKVVEELNEVIWASAKSNDSLQSLISYIAAFARKFLDVHGIELELQLPELEEDVRLVGSHRRNLYLIAKEAIHNVVKHAQTSRMQIGFVVHEEELMILFKDEGIGMVKEREYGNGIQNMKARSDAIGANLYIRNRQGTEVQISYPFNMRKYE